MNERQQSFIDMMDDPPRPIVLAGEFHCRLTTAESNEWGEYCRAQACYPKFHIAHRQFQLCPEQATLTEYLIAETLMRLVAREWYDMLVVRRSEKAVAAATAEKGRHDDGSRDD